MKTTIRLGLTLIEMLVVIAISAVLLSMLVAAVHRVRETALRADSQNRLKQVVLATSLYAQEHQGRLPTAPQGKTIGNTSYPVESMPSVFRSILPYLVGVGTPFQGKQKKSPFIPDLLSPADPTVYEASSKQLPVTSYAANAWVFDYGSNTHRSFGDGMSNTIGFAEHYAVNCGGASFSYVKNMPPTLGIRRATFADSREAHPKITGNPPVTVSNIANWTFQAAPAIPECRPWVPQTPHPSGMLVALMDGSVRIVAPNISQTTFWSAVTPASGEILGNDW